MQKSFRVCDRSLSASILITDSSDPEPAASEFIVPDKTINKYLAASVTKRKGKYSNVFAEI